MERIKATLTLLLAVGMLATAGCETYQQRKHTARLRYERASAKAKLPLVRDLLQEDRLDEAYKLISECVAIDPENAEGQALKGEVAMAMGQLGEAEKCLTRSVEIDPKLHRAWAHLGTVVQANKEPDRAVECFQKALELDPRNEEYIMLMVQASAAQGRYDEALGVLKLKIAVLPDNVRLRIAEGDIRHRQGDVAGATLAYRQALVLDEDNPEVMESLGYCYIAQEQWAQAADLFQQLAQSATGSSKAAYQQVFATCSMKAGQYGRAVGVYDSLSVEDRDNPDLWLQMGRAALGSGQAQRALTCADRALVLQPGWEDAVALKGCAQYLQADYTWALASFREISTSERLGGFGWLMMGRCHQQLGQLTQAQAAYEKAAALSPDSRLVSLLAPPADKQEVR
jgi:tetratricopeptide (TPR) repeat protein